MRPTWLVMWPRTADANPDRPQDWGMGVDSHPPAPGHLRSKLVVFSRSKTAASLGALRSSAVLEEHLDLLLKDVFVYHAGV